MGSMRVRLRTGGFDPRTLVMSSSTRLSLWNAGQPTYVRRQSEFGFSHTAKVSAKSSVGWDCAYHSPR